MGDVEIVHKSTKARVTVRIHKSPYGAPIAQQQLGLCCRPVYLPMHYSSTSHEHPCPVLETYWADIIKYNSTCHDELILLLLPVILLLLTLT